MTSGKPLPNGGWGNGDARLWGSAKATDGGGWCESSHRNRCLMVTAALTRAERRGGGMWNVGRGMWDVECWTWNVGRGMLDVGRWNVECGHAVLFISPTEKHREAQMPFGVLLSKTRDSAIFLEHEICRRPTDCCESYQLLFGRFERFVFVLQKHQRCLLYLLDFTI